MHTLAAGFGVRVGEPYASAAIVARVRMTGAGAGGSVSGKSSHVYLVFEEVTSGSEWGVLLRSPTHSNASSPMHDGKFLFKNM